MRKFEIGSIAIILGLLALSFEIYFLKVLQVINMQTGSWPTNAWSYLDDSVIQFALFLTIVVIVFGIILLISSIRDKMTKN